MFLYSFLLYLLLVRTPLCVSFSLLAFFLSLSNLCHDVFGEQWLSHRQHKTVLLLLWPWLVVLFFNQ